MVVMVAILKFIETADRLLELMAETAVWVVFQVEVAPEDPDLAGTEDRAIPVVTTELLEAVATRVETVVVEVGFKIEVIHRVVTVVVEGS
jgi:hypothetical protein